MHEYYKVQAQGGKACVYCQDEDIAEFTKKQFESLQNVKYEVVYFDRDYLIFDDGRKDVVDSDLTFIEVFGLRIRFYIPDLSSLCFQLRLGLKNARDEGTDIVLLDSELAIIRIRVAQAQTMLDCLDRPDSFYKEKEDEWFDSHAGFFHFSESWGVAKESGI